jgi:cell wall-associated NlpC family hydrolase
MPSGHGRIDAAGYGDEGNVGAGHKDTQYQGMVGRRSNGAGGPTVGTAAPRAGRGPLRAATRPWLRGVLRCGLLLAAASLAVLPTAGLANAAAAPGTPGTGTQSLTQAEAVLQPILNQLHSTYQLAEAATQKYDALSEQLVQAETDDAELQVMVANAQSNVDSGTVLAGQVAAAQYRNGTLSQLGQLLFADDPQQALHDAELLSAAGKSQAAFLAQLKQDQQALIGAKAASAAAKQHAAELVAAQGVAKATINKELDTVRQQVASLTGAQQEQLSQLEQKDADAAQLAFLASGVLGNSGLKPSAAGAAAVAYAFQQIGSPYVWGGQGPYADGFDCSGLTSQAWLHAGQPIPRTSEEQWAQLTHVPLDALRPGDLIVYFTGASHVALYIGGGNVIQAPHTGAFVHVTPMAQNPILGAVRPDPNSPSLGSYAPPKIPVGGEGPQPIGPGPVNHPVPTPPATPPGWNPTPKPTPKPKPTPTGGNPTPSPTPTPTPTPGGGSPSPSAPVTPPSETPSAPAAGPSTVPTTAAQAPASSSPTP